MSLLERTATGEWPKFVFPKGPNARAREILAETAAKHGEKVKDVIGVRKFGSLVLCRREAAWRIAKETNLSFPQIGSLLNKDHSTIIWAIRRQNEATGEDVRELGFCPIKRIERSRKAARLCIVTPLTEAQKRRRNRLSSDARRRRAAGK